jgi:formamidopyrimidine-DNA glycosylase
VPEGLEVEIWTQAAHTLIGRVVKQAWVDPRCGGEGVTGLHGAAISAVTRRAKTMIIRTDRGLLGVHFGMTGRLVIDGHSPIPRLEYASSRDLADWDRCRVEFMDGGVLRINDPRRWSRYEVVSPLANGCEVTHGLFGPYGPDALSLTGEELRAALAGARRSVKSCLLDQRCVAGLGNLCADEVMWRAGVDPRRPAHTLNSAEVNELAAVMRVTLAEMLAAGGSHRGQISPGLRKVGGLCPRDGTALVSAVVAGRTTWWCPSHQH